jgi:hypothetical protein
MDADYFPATVEIKISGLVASFLYSQCLEKSLYTLVSLFHVMSQEKIFSIIYHFVILSVTICTFTVCQYINIPSVMQQTIYIVLLLYV